MAATNREQWRAHLQRIDKEGLTTKAYADREGVAASALYHWRKVFRADKAGQPLGAKTGRSAFVALGVAGSAPPVPATQCCLFLSSGVRLEMAALPDTGWLAQLGRDLAQGSR